MLQISFSRVILIIIAFYHGRVIFKIVFIFPLLKSGNIKVVGGEIFCSGSMLCFNNPLKFIFWEDRSLCVHQTTILFCPFPISVAVKIKLWLCNMLILDSRVLHCLRFHRKDTCGEEVVWDLLLKSGFAFSSKGLVQALSELQSRAAHSSLCLLAQAAVHVHTHNLCTLSRDRVTLWPWGQLEHPFSKLFELFIGQIQMSCWEWFLAHTNSLPSPGVVWDSAYWGEGKPGQEHPNNLIVHMLELRGLNQCPRHCSAD